MEPMEPGEATPEPDANPDSPIEEPGEQTEPPAGDTSIEEDDDDETKALLASLGTDEKDAQIAALNARLEAMQAQLDSRPPEQTKPIEFVGEDEFEEIFQDRAKLNEKLNAIYQKAIETAAAQSSATTRQQVALQQIADRFYTENPDLKPYMKMVGDLTQKLITQKPNATYAEILPLVARAVRAFKKLPTPVRRPGVGSGKNTPPRLPNVNGRAGNPGNAPPPKSKMEADIDAMFKAIGE